LTLPDKKKITVFCVSDGNTLEYVVDKSSAMGEYTDSQLASMAVNAPYMFDWINNQIAGIDALISEIEETIPRKSPEVKKLLEKIRSHTQGMKKMSSGIDILKYENFVE